MEYNSEPDKLDGHFSETNSLCFCLCKILAETGGIDTQAEEFNR